MSLDSADLKPETARTVRVWMVTSEVSPFSKSGGLGDVCGSLPQALRAEGAEVALVAPLYRTVRGPGIPLRTTARITVPVGDREVAVEVEMAQLPASDVSVHFLRMDYFYDRPALYGPDGGEYHDNCERFVLLCRGALELARALRWRPDVVHAHDWHAGLTPVYLKTIYARDFPRTGCVFTIHNLAHQGVFAPSVYPVTGLDWKYFHWTMLEYWGRFSFLKGGIVFANKLTTVSPTYAREIQTPEFGFGMDGAIRSRADHLVGILNGIDPYEWDPQYDARIPQRYSAGQLEGKVACRRELLRGMGLEAEDHTPLVGIVSRLAWQKGLDLFLAVGSRLVGRGCRFAILGEGDVRIREGLEALRAAYPGRVAFYHGFREELAHPMHAGCDMMLIPSRYEPCGLVQMHALRYGTVPVVRATGGLADTVRDGETGFVFRGYTPDALSAAMERALEAFRDGLRWQAIMRTAMAQDFTWNRSAREYLRLYESVRGR